MLIHACWSWANYHNLYKLIRTLRNKKVKRKEEEGNKIIKRCYKIIIFCQWPFYMVIPEKKLNEKMMIDFY
jgi:hypothetical protein